MRSRLLRESLGGLWAAIALRHKGTKILNQGCEFHRDTKLNNACARLRYVAILKALTGFYRPTVDRLGDSCFSRRQLAKTLSRQFFGESISIYLY